MSNGELHQPRFSQDSFHAGAWSVYEESAAMAHPHIALDMFTQIRALKAGVTAQWGLPVFDPMVVPNDQLLRMITFEVPRQSAMEIRLA